ncbi:hypothetical protein LJK88_44340 [Paenibacillus sp. P26]|nr:hypothetical protein LJK88_44340 [Paenibacillus sp. P26]
MLTPRPMRKESPLNGLIMNTSPTAVAKAITSICAFSFFIQCCTGDPRLFDA